MKHSFLLAGALALAGASGCHAQAPAVDAQKIAAEVRAEATRKNNDPAGRALPLLAHWNVGTYYYTWPDRPRGFDPAYQVGMVEKGHRMMPAFAFPGIPKEGEDAAATIEKNRAYYEAALKRAAELNLPITLEATQWESVLTNDKKFFDLPAAQNPNVVTPEGVVEKKVSPFAPVEHWREVGKMWGSSPLMQQLQKWYPNPPLVMLLSNNEHGKLRWQDVETDARYLEKYGKGRGDEFKRRVVAEGWIERYRALQAGMRDALSPAWQDKAMFVGYNAFGPAAIGRWGGWTSYTLHVPGRVDPNPLMWDGGTPPYYTNNWDPSTDFKVWSVQVQAMNWEFIRREALKLNPDFWFEFSVWDGHEPKKDNDKRAFYKSIGHDYTPTRYAASTQYGMWLLRPRAIREFRGWTDSIENMEPWFLALAGTVNRVYENDTLKYFWRKGELVPNRAHQHLYQAAIPEEYKSADRWFLLDTNLDPPRPWKLETELPVFSLALVDGAAGARRWLVYAHSPLQDRTGVEIEVPEYGKITVDVPIAGAFYVVDEKQKNVTPVK